MFAASSSEPLLSVFKLFLYRQKMAPQCMSHVLLIEVLRHVSFINMTHVKSS